MRAIEPTPEHPIPNASHVESRTCSAGEKDNIHAEARSMPDFWENASTARMTRISTAINNGEHCCRVVKELSKLSIC